MALITASLFTALDGVADPDAGNWHFPYFNDEMGEAVVATGAKRKSMMSSPRETAPNIASRNSACRRHAENAECQYKTA